MWCGDTQRLTGSVPQFLHLLYGNKERLPPGIIAIGKSAALGPLGSHLGGGGVAAIRPFGQALRRGNWMEKAFLMNMSQLMSSDRRMSNIILRVFLVRKKGEKDRGAVSCEV